MGIDKVCVRQECLQPADVWTRPMGSEVKEVLESAGFTASQAARSIGLTSKGGDRTVRRWISEESPIPYAAWALLCDFAGLGIIWKR